MLTQIRKVADRHDQLLRHIVWHVQLVGQLHTGTILSSIGNHLTGVVLEQLEDGGVRADDRLATGVSGRSKMAAPVVAPGARPQGGDTVEASGVGVAVEEHDVGGDELLGGCPAGHSQVDGDMIGRWRKSRTAGKGRGGTDKSAWYLGRPEGQVAVIDAHVVVRCRQLWQGADLQRDVCELREAEGGGCNVFEVDALVLRSQ